MQLATWAAVAPASTALPLSTAPSIVADPVLATAGYYRLTWSGSADPRTVYVVEESRAADFSAAATGTIYEGRDAASVITGREDGVYFYRVRAAGEDSEGPSGWSEPVRVEVRHHPLTHALAFFSAGAVVFVATLVLIVGGTLAVRREQGG